MKIQFARLTEAKAKRYRNTLKILELADKGLKSADIANVLNIPLKDVRNLRRTAVNTIDYVEEKVKLRTNEINESNSKHENILRKRRRRTLSKNARPSHESIVEPYREIVIAEVKKGGNHRTIHPILKEQGFKGCPNAIYQYILKLRKEIPEEISRDTVENPPDLKLEKISRHTVYKQVLNKASESRPEKEEGSQKSTSKDKAPGDDSPLSDKAQELIYGVNNTDDSEQPKENKEEKTEKKTKFLKRQ